MNKDIKKAEHLSFWQLIQITSIEIPIIQRDYAQGREDKVKIRIAFLDSLKKAILKTPVELDFIYGNVKNKTLQPLDGQQRLTTLFLLHFYIAHKEGFLDCATKETLKKFTYKTRISSREFCSSLIDKNFEFTNDEIQVSELIKDCSWYILSWEKDPTIKAMLIMLDAIHDKFRGTKKVWERLTEISNRPITFHYIELENFGLSDDLYIKMNARGLQLSTFENFKADFNKYISDNDWDSSKRITDTFSHKVDTVWTDLFWDDGLNKVNFDKSYISVFNAIALLSLALGKQKSEVKEKKIQELLNSSENLTPNDFDFVAYNDLYNSLDIYKKNNHSKITFDFPFWNYIPTTSESLFSIVGNKPTYPQLVLFFAQTKYLLTNQIFNRTFFDFWMRVIRNIVQNIPIDSAAAFVGAINLVNELSRGSENIHHFLATTKIDSQFASTQVNEEVVKAKIPIEDKTVIFETEDTNFCKGRIDFALYCINYKPGDSNFNSVKLRKVRNNFDKYLNGKDISNEFRRALLTIGDGKFYNYWESWVYVVGAPKRCLIHDIEDLKKYAYNTSFRHYLKDLFDKLDKKDLSILVNDFISKNQLSGRIPNWKMRLIADPKLLDGNSHYIAVDTLDAFCYLMRVGRPRDKSSCKKIK